MVTVQKDISGNLSNVFYQNTLWWFTNAKYAWNKNILVIGGSRSGKTRFYVKKVNLMRMHSKYLEINPKELRSSGKKS